MYHLKLIKALSYIGVVSATKEHPDVYTDDEVTARAAVASGYFALVGQTEPETPAQPEPAYSGKTLAEMTVAEIETFATYNGVSLKGLRSKAKMIERLTEELGASAVAGELTYGSPTMTELQEE